MNVNSFLISCVKDIFNKTQATENLPIWREEYKRLRMLYTQAFDFIDAGLEGIESKNLELNPEQILEDLTSFNPHLQFLVDNVTIPIDNAPIGVAMLKDGKIMYSNDAVSDIFGYTKAELLSIEPGVLISDDFRDKINYMHGNIGFVGSNSPSGFDVKVVAKGAINKWINISSTQFINNEQNFIIDFIRDITIRKDFELRLLNSDNLYFSTINSLRDFIFVIDRDFRILLANEAYMGFHRTIFGDKPFINENLSDVRPFFDDNTWEEYNSVFLVGKEHESDQKFIIKGKVFYLKIKKSPVVINGSVVRVITIIIDITKDTIVKQTMALNEQKFRQLAYEATEGIIMSDLHAKIVDWNRTMERITGYTNEEMVGKMLNNFEQMLPDHTPISTDLTAYHQLLKNPAPDVFNVKREFRLQKKNGNLANVQITLFPIKTDAEYLLGILLNDVTDIRRIEQMREQRRQEVVKLSQAALDMMEIQSLHGTHTYIVNWLSNNLLGAPVFYLNIEEIKSTAEFSAYTGIQTSQREILNEAFPAWDKTHISLTEEFLILLQRGKLFKLEKNIPEFVLQSYSNEELNMFNHILGTVSIYGIGLTWIGQIFGVILLQIPDETATDHTPVIEAFVHQATIAVRRKIIEADLAKARTRAEEADHMKSMFLANMSHEIRSPLNGILGFTDLMRRMQLPDKAQKFTHLIHQNGNHLLELINDIIDFSKIEAGQLEINPEQANLYDLVTQIDQMFRNQLSSQGILIEQLKFTVVNELEAGNSQYMLDSLRWRQVIINLLSNAFKFTTEGEVRFIVKKQERDLYFEVSDTGIGIPPEKLKWIFDRYSQVGPQITRQYGGSGLGLSITKGLVSLMGGEIKVLSQEGAGSVFSFKIPALHTPSQPELEQVLAASQQIDLKNKHVLLIEDDIISQEYILNILENLNVKLTIKSSARSIDKWLQELGHIDIALIDLQLPDVDGFDVIKKIKEYDAAIYCIAQTAFATAEYKKRCFDAGFNFYISKPYKSGHLVEALMQAN